MDWQWQKVTLATCAANSLPPRFPPCSNDRTSFFPSEVLGIYKKTGIPGIDEGGKLWNFVILYLKEFDQSLRGHSLLAAIFRPKGLAACVFGAKNRKIHLFAIYVFSPFFIFFEWQLARTRFFVPTGVCKALFRDSASVLNAFWPARIVVACVSVFRGEIFYGCRPMIFPGFFWRRLARPRFVYQLASGKPCSCYG